MDITQKLTELINLAGNVKSFIGEYEKKIEAMKSEEKQISWRLADSKKQLSDGLAQLSRERQDFNKKVEETNAAISQQKKEADSILSEAKYAKEQAAEMLKMAKEKMAQAESELASADEIKKEYEVKRNKLLNAIG